MKLLAHARARARSLDGRGERREKEKDGRGKRLLREIKFPIFLGLKSLECVACANKSRGAKMRERAINISFENSPAFNLFHGIFSYLINACVVGTRYRDNAIKTLTLNNKYLHE